MKSTSNIETADITDKRTNSNLCGIVNSLISVDGEELYQQFKDYIQEITSDLVFKNQDNTITGKIIAQGGIEGDVKGDLQGNVTGDCSGSSSSCSRE